MQDKTFGFLLDVFDVLPRDTKFDSSQMLWPFLVDKLLPKIYVDAFQGGGAEATAAQDLVWFASIFDVQNKFGN